ncbi:MAG: hypothetical protein VB092_08500 [Oscillospiraceae bacterium]|nr:hypothetical protein [Oscillospiraceae bacterium]
MSIKKIICALLTVAVLLTALCGCGYNPETVLDIDGYEFPAGVYLALQLQALGEAASAKEMSYYYTISILDETMDDGRTVREFVNDRTVELCRNYVFVEREYERLGLAENDSDSWYVQYMASNYWQNYATNYQKNGISYDSFEKLYANQYERSAVLSALYGDGGEMALDAQEKLDYYLQHFTRVDYIEFPTADENGLTLTSDTTALLEGIADEMLDTAKAKNSLEAAYLSHYDQVYALTNSALQADAENYQTTLTADSIVSDLTGNFDAEFVTMALSMSAGEFGVYKGSSATYVFLVKGTDAEDSALSDYNAYVVEGAAADRFDTYVTAGGEAYTVTEDARARKYYSPDNIYINSNLFS